MQLLTHENLQKLLLEAKLILIVVNAYKRKIT